MIMWNGSVFRGNVRLALVRLGEEFLAWFGGDWIGMDRSGTG